ncbi:MAG: PP2C family protein-serine/threonine phosphatase [Planctomycetota bacterium]|jgi:sigma-B regulation protein RsbU (phosphoserine phosphatase)
MYLQADTPQDAHAAPQPQAPASVDAAELTRQLQALELKLEELQAGQENLLAEPSEFPDIDVAVRYVPAFRAGGDFYDILDLGNGHYGLIVADVAGHDLGVAYLTGAFKALSVSFTSEVLTTTETMVMLNAALGKFLQCDQYATASYAKVDTSNRRVKLIGAAHPAPLWQKKDGPSSFIELPGDVLGMFDVVQCGTQVINAEPGDRLFLYSDGLTESYRSPDGKSSRTWGERKFLEGVQARAALPIGKVVDEIVDELLDLCGGTISDDVVVLGIQF